MVWLLFMRRLAGAGPTLSNPSSAARQSALDRNDSPATLSATRVNCGQELAIRLTEHEGVRTAAIYLDSCICCQSPDSYWLGL
jgi:hypothetical protein